MKHEKDKKKLFCKNIMCPCNNAGGDDGTAPLEEHYCLNGFCEYPSVYGGGNIITQISARYYLSVCSM